MMGENSSIRHYTRFFLPTFISNCAACRKINRIMWDTDFSIFKKSKELWHSSVIPAHTTRCHYRSSLLPNHKQTPSLLINHEVHFWGSVNLNSAFWIFFYKAKMLYLWSHLLKNENFPPNYDVKHSLQTQAVNQTCNPNIKKFWLGSSERKKQKTMLFNSYCCIYPLTISVNNWLQPFRRQQIKTSSKHFCMRMYKIRAFASFTTPLFIVSLFKCNTINVNTTSLYVRVTHWELVIRCIGPGGNL